MCCDARTQLQVGSSPYWDTVLLDRHTEQLRYNALVWVELNNDNNDDATRPAMACCLYISVFFCRLSESLRGDLFELLGSDMSFEVALDQTGLASRV